jgi:hypothetical protein
MFHTSTSIASYQKIGMASTIEIVIVEEDAANQQLLLAQKWEARARNRLEVASKNFDEALADLADAGASFASTLERWEGVEDTHWVWVKAVKMMFGWDIKKHLNLKIRKLRCT